MTATRDEIIREATMVRRDLTRIEDWLIEVPPGEHVYRTISLAVDVRDDLVEILLCMYDDHPGLCELTSWDIDEDQPHWCERLVHRYGSEELRRLSLMVSLSGDRQADLFAGNSDSVVA